MKNEKGYTPMPIDTSDVQLPQDILDLAEELAENTHEVWAQGRVNGGWVYGEQRDDTKKTHPCLIPYDDLSEEEKEYDRATAFETLRLIIKLGYKIEKQ